MKKLELHFDNELQGKFELKDLNILLVFQVNCPGCFSFALPFFNKLYQEFNSSDVSFLALSTAFEDFDKNTLENTSDLVKAGVVVGETKSFLNKRGFDKVPYSLNFPIAMDKTGEENTVVLDNAVEVICSTNPNYKIWPDFEQTALRKRVHDYLNSLDKISLTFTLNQLRGTPSFVMFNSNYEILNEWFGHITYDEVVEKVHYFK
ncbi:MAG: hypothetical protein COA58_10860 [Bacteroidetes bacterium]|nr:MAG: hypothetical protein COA58_10860 [Bacteroidota bacterium]